MRSRTQKHNNKHFNKKSRKQSGGLSEDEKKICKNLDNLIRSANKNDKDLKPTLVEILNKCDKLTKEHCIVSNYFKSDEWYKYTDYIRGLYQNKKGMIQKMKDKMEEMQEENYKLEEQIEQLQKQLTINKHLAEHIFNSNILFEGNEDETFKTMLTHGTEYMFNNDCEVCDDKNYWESVVEELSADNISDEEFNKKLVDVFKNYCDKYDDE
jgi:hypothetical protein